MYGSLLLFLKINCFIDMNYTVTKAYSDSSFMNNIPGASVDAAMHYSIYNSHIIFLSQSLFFRCIKYKSEKVKLLVYSMRL